MDIEKKVHDCINAELINNGYEIVAVEWVNTNGDNNLNIFIDNEIGIISLNDCERVNNIIDPLLDSLDPTCGQPYILNVSSKGLDRPLITDRDYQRNYKKEVEVKLNQHINKKLVLEGVLIDKQDKCIIIKTTTKKVESTLTIDMSNVQWVRPLVKFK